MKAAVKRTVLLTLGLLSTGLAIAGVFIPGLPTTIFLIIAVWAFASSSERLLAWLHRTPIFKKPMVHVKKFQTDGAVPLYVKYIAAGFAWGSFVLVMLTAAPGATAVKIAVAAAACLCTVVMLCLPTSRV